MPLPLAGLAGGISKAGALVAKGGVKKAVKIGAKKVVKSAAKKISKESLKKAAKKKIKGKIKDKFLGRKEDKRKRITNIMDQDGGGASGGGGGGSKSLGGQDDSFEDFDKRKLLAPTIDRASKQSGSNNTISDKSVENLSIIASTLMDVDTVMKGSLALDEIRGKKQRKAKEKKERSMKERMREGITGAGKAVGGKVKKKVSKGAGDIFSWVNKLVFGVVLVGLWELKPILMPLLKFLLGFSEIFIKVVGWVYNIVATLIHWAYQLYDSVEGLVKNLFGEEGLKVFQDLMDKLNIFFNAALMAVMALLKFKWLRNFAKGMLKRIGNLIKRIPGVKQIANAAKNIGGKAVNLAKGIGSKLMGVGRGVGSKVMGFGRKLLGAGKGVATKGAAKVGGFAVKIFGKAAKVIGPAFKSAKPFLSKFFGKVPIVGPLIIGIVSLLSGEPAAQALFKAMGAALGGFLGTFIPIPILGTLIGETIGVFVGDLFYKLIFGGGLSAVGKALKDAFTGFVKPIFDFFSNGFSNFTQNFPTFDIPDVGLQDLYVPLIENLGLGKLLEFKIPGRVLGVKVPFIPAEGFSLRQMLDSLPKLPDILGWFARFIPPLEMYVENGRLMRLPQIWQLANPIFMVKHMAQSFLPDMFGGSSSSNKSVSSEESKGDVKEDKKKKKGLIPDDLVAYLKFKSAEKAAAEKKKKEEEAAAKEEKKTAMVKNIQTFMELPLDHTGDSLVSKESDSEDKSGSLSSYPSYDERSPQTAMIPMPPQVKASSSGGEDDSGGFVGSSGGGQDPFETFYAHSGGVV